MTPSLLRMAGDERLARMVTAGNDGAFTALYDRYHDVLVRYCRSLVRDDQDALDAFQSTMLNALRALREDRRRAPVRPWLFRIAHNESVTVLRRRPASEPLDDRQIATVDVHRAAEDREALAGLLEDLEGLTEHQRGALLLRELGGLAYEDVATALDTTPLAARQAVFAARASLHDQREGRELPCAMVQRRLSDADRRASRTRAVRAHLRRCDDCRGFASAIGRRRRAAILVPIPPAFASSGLLATVLDGAGGSATAVGGGAVATGLVAKAAVALSAAAVATGAAGTDAPRRAAPKASATTTAERAAAETTTTATRPAAAETSAGAVQLASAAPAPATATSTAKAKAAPSPTRSAAQDEDAARGDDAPDDLDPAPVRLAEQGDDDNSDNYGEDAATPSWGDHHRDRAPGDATGPAPAGTTRPIAARPRRPSAAVTPMAATTPTTEPAAEPTTTTTTTPTTAAETTPATTTTTTAEPAPATTTTTTADDTATTPEASDAG